MPHVASRVAIPKNALARTPAACGLSQAQGKALEAGLRQSFHGGLAEELASRQMLYHHGKLRMAPSHIR